MAQTCSQVTRMQLSSQGPLLSSACSTTSCWDLRADPSMQSCPENKGQGVTACKALVASCRYVWSVAPAVQVCYAHLLASFAKTRSPNGAALQRELHMVVCIGQLRHCQCFGICCLAWAQSSETVHTGTERCATCEECTGWRPTLVKWTSLIDKSYLSPEKRLGAARFGTTIKVLAKRVLKHSRISQSLGPCTRHAAIFSRVSLVSWTILFDTLASNAMLVPLQAWTTFQEQVILLRMSGIWI